MNKVIKWVLIIFFGLFVLGTILGDSDNNSDGSKKSINKNQIEEVSKDLIENDEAVNEEVDERESEDINQPRHAILSGKDPETGEVLLEEINVWEKAGSGGVDNMAIGNIPHNTRVEVLEEKEVDGNIFYHIRSSVGKVSILPTDFNARKVAMEKRPKEDWHVYADESFPVEGWVTDSFITELSD